VPAIMPALPIDRFDGHTLRYRLKEGQPVLYSVGTNREDDGGELPARGSRHWQSLAQHWVPAAHAKETWTTDAEGRRMPYYSGDWVLWPPVNDPLMTPSQAP
jgi:hypothetical protein